MTKFFKYAGISSALLLDLAAYYKMEESSGSDRIDSTANGLDLSENTAVAKATGIVGDAADFDGVDGNRLDHVFNSLYDLSSTDFTLTYWINFDATGGNLRIFSISLNGTGTSDICIDNIYSLSTDTITFRVSDGTTRTSAVDDIAGTIPTATWIFVACRWNTTTETMDLRLNAQSDVTANPTHGIQSPGTQTYNVGAAPNDIQAVNGKIDEMGFWRRRLTDAEVTELYNSGSGLTYPF